MSLYGDVRWSRHLPGAGVVNHIAADIRDARAGQCDLLSINWPRNVRANPS